jgi:hypothetical protein
MGKRMSTNFDFQPYIAHDQDDAEREAQVRSFRTKVPYFWGVRTCIHGVEEWIVAPDTTFRQFADAGWLRQDTCGRPRQPIEDTRAYVTCEYTDAVGEAVLRVHRASVATGIAVREEGMGDAFLVFPLEQRPKFERVGWEMCDEFIPE